ncbi:hypothetical protein [Haloarchaeobius iranensis]|uniref:Uncharacterized protein n=1 Tax=Haloarchaeobius iranensis TaxID=996166 RepID=A0A1H0BA87_9EURY|nr:hypothetical protein [Haloarchaeobius iranensis]SDN42570.1 hypothetical protein SAMN05192554_1366 [Haloarchaeobius iranensis]
MPTDSPDVCRFCARTVTPTATDTVHRVYTRRADGDGAAVATEQFACDHCFDDVRALVADMEPRPDGDDNLADHDCGLCGGAVAPDAGATRLVVDRDRYLLCPDCTDVFDEFCASVPETAPEPAADAPTATEVVADGGAPEQDDTDLGTVLDSGLDDVVEGDRVHFDLRRDTGDGSAPTETVSGDVTSADTSYIGGSTIYVDGDDGEEYRVESSFSSDAVRVTTVHGHDIEFQGHLDELRVDR